MIYLDNAATTKISLKVYEEMLPYLQEEYGNPGSLHSLGRRANNAVAKARQQVADFINADPSQIIFTSGGTEANNMVFSLCSNTNYSSLVSAGEHESVLKAGRNYSHVCNTIPLIETGSIDYQEFLNMINNQNYRLVSVMHTNNETGAVNPVRDICKVCYEYGILFHTDCVQAGGFSRLDVNKIGCDFMSISSHKIHGPKGVGALYVRDMSLIRPIILGGSLQEFGLRGGTENVAGIVGFGEACERSGEYLDDLVVYLHSLTETFFKTLLNALERYGLRNLFHVNGPPISEVRKTYSLRFDEIPNETLIVLLDAQGVCVSAGSACTASDHKASHVLTAMGLTEAQANNTIRVSFSLMNTTDEVMEAAKIIANSVRTIKTSV